MNDDALDLDAIEQEWVQVLDALHRRRRSNRDPTVEWACANATKVTDEVRGLRGRVGELEAALTAIRDYVAEQAEDAGLWFVATTAPEAYLQQELRRLHETIEHPAAGGGIPPEPEEGE